MTSRHNQVCSFGTTSQISPTLTVQRSSMCNYMFIMKMRRTFRVLTCTSFNSTSAQGLFDVKDSGNCVWSSPHSNAFVDLDGDCLAGSYTCHSLLTYPNINWWSNRLEQILFSHVPAQMARKVSSFGSITVIKDLKWCNKQTCQMGLVLWALWI
jgi:hypothetical protein